MKINWRNLISGPTNPTTVVAKEGGDPIPEALVRISILSERFNKLYQTGKFAKAIPIAQEGLEISEKALGPDHLQTSMLLNNLAEMFRLTADYGKAEPLFQRALAIREKELGPDHPQTATVLNNLALLYTSLKEYTKAEPLQQRSLEIDEKTLGPDHPQTASALGNLAALYYVMGDKAKAEPLYERALKICEQALGVNHPQTTTIRQNLATVKESLIASGESVSPAANDEAKIVSLNQRVALLYKLGDYAEAIPVAQECVELSETVRGPDDPKTAMELNNLAEVYAGTGDYAKAEPLYERALAICEKALGSDDSQTKAIRRNLAGARESLTATTTPPEAHAPLNSFRFSNEEFDTLLFAPMWVYSAVAWVDGAPKDYEKEALNREVSAPESYDAPLFQLLLKVWRDKWDTLLPRWNADKRNTPEGLREARRILDAKLHVDDAKEVKESLYRFGRAIAESGGEGAPGGGVLQMPKASLDEQDVLIDIGIMLGLQDGVRPLSPWLDSMVAALDERVAPAAG